MSVDVVITYGNKFVAIPNQNLQVYTKPFPSHSTTIIEHPSSPDKHISYDDNVEESNHVGNHVEHVQLKPTHHPSHKNPPHPEQKLCITFDNTEMIDAPYCHLYIFARVAHIPSSGVLVEPFSIVIVITEEYFFSK